MNGLRRLLANLRTLAAGEEVAADVFLLLGLAFVGYGLSLVSLAAAFTCVGAVMLALVTVPRMIVLWRDGDDRK